MTEKKKYLFFGSHLAFLAGGAEFSMSAIIKKLKNVDTSIYSFDFSDSYKANNNLKAQYLSHNKFLFNHFPFFSYFLNRGCFNNINNNFNEVHAYTRYGINLIKHLHKKNTKCVFYFYIRSLTDFGEYVNLSDSLFLKILKRIIISFEYPFKKIYLNDLRLISKYTKFITNSKYTRDHLFKTLGFNSIIIRPDLEINSFKSLICNSRSSESFIKFIGDSKWKGISIIIKLANLFPNEKFIIYSRKITTTTTKKNIVYHPWTDDRSEIFSNVKIFLVPSQIPETYGRVSAESFKLGIPVLVSNIGALPETVNFNKKFIVKNYRSSYDWKISLESLLCAE